MRKKGLSSHHSSRGGQEWRVYRHNNPLTGSTSLLRGVRRRWGGHHITPPMGVSRRTEGCRRNTHPKGVRRRKGRWSSHQTSRGVQVVERCRHITPPKGGWEVGATTHHPPPPSTHHSPSTGWVWVVYRFTKQQEESFRYTTIQLNKKFAAKMHVDGNNHGPSKIIALCDVESPRRGLTSRL